MLLKNISKDKLCGYVYDTREEMGKAAAKKAAEAINEILETKKYANVVFAAAPSQNEMLESLLKQDVDFSKVNAFHMDEYVDFHLDVPQSFANYLTQHIFAKAEFRTVNYIGDAGRNVDETLERYTRLLSEYPVDVVLLGIGENGHIAFNDPPVADFNDEHLIKKVQLDEKCRNQQVHDGCFPTLDDVPTHALTLTVPALLSAKYMICTVPASTKAQAVYDMLNSDIGEHCPATALRLHDGAFLFLDRDSAAKIID